MLNNLCATIDTDLGRISAIFIRIGLYSLSIILGISACSLEIYDFGHLV